MFIAVINENFSVAEEAKRGMQATSHSEQHSRSTISRWTSLLYPYLWLRPKSTRVTAESPSSTSVLGEAEVFVQQSPLPTDHGPEFSQVGSTIFESAQLLMPFCIETRSVEH